jgi:hypothetical protein
VNDIPALDRLEDVLVDAIADDHHRRDRQRAAARRVGQGGVIAAVGALALTVGATLLPSSGDSGDPFTAFVVAPAAAIVEAEESASAVTIELANLHADPEEFERILRDEHGLDVSLSVVPASPSVVGVLAVGGGHGSMDVEVTYTEGRTPTDDTLSLQIPAALSGPIELGIGRRAHDGEPYQVAGNAAEPGEALHCLDVFADVPAGELGRSIEARGVEIVWHHVDDYYPSADEAADRWVVAVTPFADGQVLVSVDDDRKPIEFTPAYLEHLTEGC